MAYIAVADHRQLGALGDLRRIEVCFAGRLSWNGGLVREIEGPSRSEQDHAEQPRQHVPQPHTGLACKAGRARDDLISPTRTTKSQSWFPHFHSDGSPSPFHSHRPPHGSPLPKDLPPANPVGARIV